MGHANEMVPKNVNSKSKLGRGGSKDAAGSDLGFSLQRTRFLARLLEAEPGDTVCLEVFDDVRVETHDGQVLAEEDKSSVSGNALTDRSVNLWKTLANWVVAAQEIDISATRFEIYLGRPGGGSFSNLFKAAGTTEEAIAALETVRSDLWGPGPRYPTRGEVADSIAGYVETVFGSITVSAQIIAQLDIEVGSGDQHADLKPIFLSKLVSDDALSDVAQWSHGWVKTRIDRLSEKKQPARISRDEFHRALLNFVRAHDRLDILHSFAGRPTPAQVHSERLRNYVAQLEIVDEDDVSILGAINDYLMAAADRTAWADRGDIDPAAFGRLEGDLERTWSNLKKQVSIEHNKKSPMDRGRLVCLKCLQHRFELGGLALPTHFVPGSFHALSDDLRIGWHPDYRHLLKTHKSRWTPEMVTADGDA